MCQHRTEVPRVESGIERHWREIEEAERCEGLRLLAEALRPMSARQMQSFRGDYIQRQYPGAGLGIYDGCLGGILGF